jgi:hypothetical protein
MGIVHLRGTRPSRLGATEEEEKRRKRPSKLGATKDRKIKIS